MKMNTVQFAIMTCVVALGIGGSGCNADTLMLSVKSPQDLNGGRPVRMLVRAIDQQDYVNEPYTAVADKVVAKDDSVLYSAVVYPRLPITTAIKKTGKSMGVYFFFTAPGARWKTLLEMPLPRVAEIRLSASTIESVRQH
jgi:hypothetical protein